MHCKCPLMTQSGHRSPLPAIRFYRYDDSSSASGVAMRRREFITLISGTTVMWPIATWAQQRGQVARIGVLMSTAANDPEGQARITTFRQALHKFGWIEGQNVRIDVRWAGGDAALDRKFATELAALTPDVILATASQTMAALQAVTQTVPIVFAHAVDPVGAGFVDSLARPGGNATGFVLFEYGMGAKWLELSIQSVAPSLGVELTAVNVRDPGEIERAISAFAQSSNGGLIVTAAPLAIVFERPLLAHSRH
jgi:ABC transporter substrate binding protein